MFLWMVRVENDPCRATPAQERCVWSGVWLHLVQGDGALSLSQAFSEYRAGGRRSSTSTAECWLMDYGV